MTFQLKRWWNRIALFLLCVFCQLVDKIDPWNLRDLFPSDLISLSETDDGGKTMLATAI